ncbi:unnamed protein product [Albugo candida]|uniref:Uncharacterized protein n=1 Tax=Albugo candida TaxID=65357 RepID=A0A024FXR6_9STRA|nr:unnamed protein product [Albugo candida]|eukprot:CCI11444.1 unnamed protein product [Albugo candida]
MEFLMVSILLFRKSWLIIIPDIAKFPTICIDRDEAFFLISSTNRIGSLGFVPIRIQAFFSDIHAPVRISSWSWSQGNFSEKSTATSYCFAFTQTSYCFTDARGSYDVWIDIDSTSVCDELGQDLPLNFFDSVNVLGS